MANPLHIPDYWQTVTTVDMHVGGEPLRIVTSGAPDFLGHDTQDMLKDAQKNHQQFRTRLLEEPRGHAEMYGAVLLPPRRKNTDYSVIFMDTHDYTSMCGHGIIALTTYLAMLNRPNTTTYRVRYDTPAGPILAKATIDNQQVTQVGFTGVTSYAEPKSRELNIPKIGKLICDIAFGGELYAILDARQVNLTIIPSNASKFVHLGQIIKQHVLSTDSINLYGVLFVETLSSTHIHSRNVNVFGNGSIDRSPTGTGLSARLAVHARNKEIKEGDQIVVASITGATFTGKLITIHNEQLQFITPHISGRAHLTGMHTFVFDPKDSLPNGFLLR